MKHRLCLPELAEDTVSGNPLSLGADRAHYLGRVLRLRPGAVVAVFDGQGREWTAELVSVGRRDATLVLRSQARLTPRPTPLVLAQAWLKGGATDRVVQKAVELGATRIYLFFAERSAVRLDERRRQNRLAHLAPVVMGAAEQSEQSWLPSLHLEPDLAALLERAPVDRSILLTPGRPPLAVAGDPEPLMLIVGPEGGFSPSEVALAERTSTVTLAGLGDTILRAETAPLAALAAIRHSWNWRRQG